MIARLRSLTTQWTSIVPALAVVLLAFTWGRDLPGAIVALVTLVLAGAVLAAVHHAEVVAHRVGEPFGSLVLAVAVTVIEVALIVTLMVGRRRQELDAGPGHGLRGRDDHLQRHRRPVPARRLTPPRPRGLQRRGHGRRPGDRRHPGHAQPGLPTFTTSKPGPEFSAAQLTFAAIASLVLYGLFVDDPDRAASRLLPADHPSGRGDRRRTTTPTRRPPAPPGPVWGCSASP